MNHLLFAYNWKNRFLDSEPVVSRFPSNTCGNSDILPHNPAELHPAPCMCVVCHVHGSGPRCTLKQNVFSLILLIPLEELINQKRGIYRHHILYPLWFGPPFPYDVRILKGKVSLGPNQMKIDLRKVFMEIIIYFWKRKTMETLGHALMRTLIDTLWDPTNNIRIFV